MTQEDKQLLLVDLCARLPYGVKYRTIGPGFAFTLKWIDDVNRLDGEVRLENAEIFLRPMSSMTEDELQRYHELCDVDEEVGVGSSIEIIAVHDTPKSLDYLNSIHIDYRGLIPKGLALSTETFNPYKS